MFLSIIFFPWILGGKGLGCESPTRQGGDFAALSAATTHTDGSHVAVHARAGCPSAGRKASVLTPGYIGVGEKKGDVSRIEHRFFFKKDIS